MNLKTIFTLPNIHINAYKETVEFGCRAILEAREAVEFWCRLRLEVSESGGMYG
jgi:hypothetical protein